MIYALDSNLWPQLEDKVSSIASGANGPACEGAISRKTTAMVRARSSTLGVDNQLPVRRHSFVDTSTSVNEVSSDRDQCDGLDQGGLRRSRSFSGKGGSTCPRKSRVAVATTSPTASRGL